MVSCRALVLSAHACVSAAVAPRQMVMHYVRVRNPSPSYAGSLLISTWISTQLACLRLVIYLSQQLGIRNRESLVAAGVRMGLGCPRGFHHSSLRLARGSPRGSVSGVSLPGVHLDLGRACPLEPPVRFARSVCLSPRCPSLRCPFLLSLPTRSIPSLNPCDVVAACRVTGDGVGRWVSIKFGALLLSRSTS
jgi:hypothetical protein